MKNNKNKMKKVTVKMSIHQALCLYYTFKIFNPTYKMQRVRINISDQYLIRC